MTSTVPGTQAPEMCGFLLQPNDLHNNEGTQDTD